MLVLVWRKLIHFWRKICVQNDFYIFVHSDLDFWPFDLKFSPQVTLVQRYVSTKLVVPTALPFEKIDCTGLMQRTDRQTDECNTKCNPLGWPHNEIKGWFRGLLRWFE